MSLRIHWYSRVLTGAGVRVAYKWYWGRESSKRNGRTLAIPSWMWLYTYNSREKTTLAEAQCQANDHQTTKILNQSSKCCHYAPSTDNKRKPTTRFHLLQNPIRRYRKSDVSNVELYCLPRASFYERNSDTIYLLEKVVNTLGWIYQPLN